MITAIIAKKSGRATRIFVGGLALFDLMMALALCFLGIPAVVGVIVNGGYGATGTSVILGLYALVFVVAGVVALFAALRK